MVSESPVRRAAALVVLPDHDGIGAFRRAGTAGNMEHTAVMIVFSPVVKSIFHWEGGF